MSSIRNKHIQPGGIEKKEVFSRTMCRLLRVAQVAILLQVVVPALGEELSNAQLKDMVTELARQVQVQSFAFQEYIRSDGASGIKQQRTSILGSKASKTQTYTGFKMAAAHDHANNKNTVGMGEAIFVLNGVEFRTRHNDYPLYQPHATSDVYNAVQEIEYPEVPPEVTAKATVLEQVEEMKKWFQAWARQDHSVRDYRKYFKPVLCYLEAGWTAASNQLEEAFQSDRHFIDADSWTDLQKKVFYNAYTGRKNLLENYAFLPRTIINITADGLPVYAQWNYRILCHPLKEDLPLSSIVQEDDLQARSTYRRNMDAFYWMRGARFRLQEASEGRFDSYTLLDKLMAEIPGRDNYQGYLEEKTLGDLYTDPQFTDGRMLNVAYYNRRYNIGKKDASGKSSGKRGFSDPNLFVAETTQDEMAPVYVNVCDIGHDVCFESTKRVTYGIPLEIIYTTPLQRWNPYNIPYIDNALAKSVTDNGQRNGGYSPETAYNKIGKKLYYMTPVELFLSGKDDQYDAADTTILALGMIAEDGQVRNVTASGIRIFLPFIEGVGAVRTRYPIMPVYGDGNAIGKELIALRDTVMKMKSSQYLMYESSCTCPRTTTTSTSTSTATSSETSGTTTTAVPREKVYMLLHTAASTEDGHLHVVNITEAERKIIASGLRVDTTTSVTNGHSHYVKIKFTSGRYDVVSENGLPPPFGHHPSQLKWQVIHYSNGDNVYRGRRRRRSAFDSPDHFLPDLDLDLS